MFPHLRVRQTGSTSVLSRHEFDGTTKARAVVIDWCYGFYNHQRRHSAAAGLSPVNYETAALTRGAA